MAYNESNENNAPELIEKVVYLNRVSKTVKGGRVMKFSALVVVGDGKGTVGYGLGKAAEVSEAILKGIADAKKNMVKITLAGSTIPHEVIGIFRRRCPCRHGGRWHPEHLRKMPALQQPPERGEGHHAGPGVSPRSRAGCRHPGQERGRNRWLRRAINNG